MKIDTVKSFEKLETVTKGFANKRRVAILSLLDRTPNADLDTIAANIDLGYKAVSEHLRKMYVAELITKETYGNYVLHSLTPRGKQTLSFLRRLK